MRFPRKMLLLSVILCGWCLALCVGVWCRAAGIPLEDLT